MRIPKIFLAALLLLAITGAGISYILAHDHYIGPVVRQYGVGNDALERFTRSACGDETSVINCQKVAESPYSSVAGAPIALYGFSFFLFMALLSIPLAFVTDKLRIPLVSLLLLLAAAGSIADIALLMIGIFSVGALCPLCLATYVCLWGYLGILAAHLGKNGVHPLNCLAALRGVFTGENARQSARYAIFVVAALSMAALSGYGAHRRLESVTADLVSMKNNEAIKAIISKFESGYPTAIKLPEDSFIGSPRAAVTIHEFSDFLCPACSNAARVLEEYVLENTDQVRMVHVNFPLDMTCNNRLKKQIHEGSCLLALGGICAADQGKFDEYYRAAFKNQKKNPVLSDALNLAGVAGLDRDRFGACITSPVAFQRLNEQIGLAARLSVDSTPTIYINGRLYGGKISREIIDRIVKRELQQVDKKMFFRKNNPWGSKSE